MTSGGKDVPDKDDTCKGWEADFTDLDLEAQRTDAAERENHRRGVEGIEDEK